MADSLVAQNCIPNQIDSFLSFRSCQTEMEGKHHRHVGIIPVKDFEKEQQFHFSDFQSKWNPADLDKADVEKAREMTGPDGLEQTKANRELQATLNQEELFCYWTNVE